MNQEFHSIIWNGSWVCRATSEVGLADRVLKGCWKRSNESRSLASLVMTKLRFTTTWTLSRNSSSSTFTLRRRGCNRCREIWADQGEGSYGSPTTRTRRSAFFTACAKRTSRSSNFPRAFDATDFPSRKSDRKSTRLNSSHLGISYAVFCLKKKPYVLFRETARRGRSSGIRFSHNRGRPAGCSFF